jgi:hypothetical protein
MLPRMGTETADGRIDAALEQLGERLAAEHGDDELVLLAPCVSVRGPVAVACWGGPDGEREWQVVELDSGAAIADDVLLREALALLAMAETLLERVDAAALIEEADALAAWRAHAANAAEGSSELVALAESVERAEAALRDVARTADEPAGGITASPVVLDGVGGHLRELERRWSRVDLDAQRWAQGVWEHEGELARELWAVLARVKGSVLAAPVSAVIEQGRDAGLALARDVLGGGEG